MDAICERFPLGSRAEFSSFPKTARFFNRDREIAFGVTLRKRGESPRRKSGRCETFAVYHDGKFWASNHEAFSRVRTTMYQSQRDRSLGERVEPALVLLLSIVTCGIYYLCFIYKTSKETLAYTGEQDLDPWLDVLLSIVTCGLWTVYWDYKIGQRIVRMQRLAGVRETDNSVLYLVLNLLGFGMINALIEQGHLNEIWAAHDSPRY